MKRAELHAPPPAFPWDDYLKALGQAGLADFNVTEPKFFQEVNKELATAPLGDLRAYLRVHLVRISAPYLSTPFVQADFDFDRAYLNGVKQQSPRWKRCVNWIDRDLGEALGEVFVRKAFPAQVKTDTERMVKQIRD